METDYIVLLDGREMKAWKVGVVRPNYFKKNMYQTIEGSEKLRTAKKRSI
jgi:hypothetical protein